MNQIHSTAIIEDTVSLGSGNVIGPYAVLVGNVEIGDHNWIGAHAIIGSPPEHRSFHLDARVKDPGGCVRIGSNNVIREHVAIQSPTGELTVVGDNNFLMHGTHVGHDSHLGDRVTIAPGSVLAGHVKFDSDVTVGMGVTVHQYRRIGKLAMVGMNSAVTRDVQPFSLVFGNPAKFVRPNSIGVERAGLVLGAWASSVGHFDESVLQDVNLPDSIREALLFYFGRENA